MLVEYFPNKGFSINGKFVTWGLPRNEVRKVLGDGFEPMDFFMDMEKFFPGEGKTIEGKRDSYSDFEGGKGTFMISYTNDEQLNDLELHFGFKIQILNHALVIDENIYEVVKKISDIDSYHKEIDAGNFFFPNLKLIVSSSEYMGGDGPELVYFYCTNSIEHLKDELR